MTENKPGRVVIVFRAFIFMIQWKKERFWQNELHRNAFIFIFYPLTGESFIFASKSEWLHSVGRMTNRRNRNICLTFSQPTQLFPVYITFTEVYSENIITCLLAWIVKCDHISRENPNTSSYQNHALFIYCMIRKVVKLNRSKTLNFSIDEKCHLTSSIKFLSWRLAQFSSVQFWFYFLWSSLQKQMFKKLPSEEKHTFVWLNKHLRTVVSYYTKCWYKMNCGSRWTYDISHACFHCVLFFPFLFLYIYICVFIKTFI